MGTPYRDYGAPYRFPIVSARLARRRLFPTRNAMAAMAWTPLLPEATPVGPLSALLRRRLLGDLCRLGRGAQRRLHQSVQRLRFGRRPAPDAERLNPDRKPTSSLREDKHVAAADRATRLIEWRPHAAAREAHAALFDDARGKAPRLEEPRPPQPDVDAAGVGRFAQAADPPAAVGPGRRRDLLRRPRRGVGAALSARG